MTTNQPRTPAHVTNRCHAAQVTITRHADARDYTARTGRAATYCGNCHRYHA